MRFLKVQTNNFKIIDIEKVYPITEYYIKTTHKHYLRCQYSFM